jgi:hypothetical protein
MEGSFLMKKLSVLCFCTLLAAASALADGTQMLSLQGSYDCAGPSGTDGVDYYKSVLEIDPSRSTVTETNQFGKSIFVFVDKSQLLSPMKRKLGFSLLVINVTEPVFLEIMKSGPGFLFVTKRNEAYPDESQSTSPVVTIDPHMVCQQKRG